MKKLLHLVMAFAIGGWAVSGCRNRLANHPIS